MSLYNDSVYSHHHRGRYHENSPRQSRDLVVFKDPNFPERGDHHHHHRHEHGHDSHYYHQHQHRPRHRKDGRLIRSRSLHRRGSSSSDSDRHTRKSLVPRRPRSASRVRVLEPALAVHTSSSSSCTSSSDEGDTRRHRRSKQDDNTRIRAVSRPGRKNQYAFVRKPSRKKKGAAKPVAYEVEDDHHHHHHHHHQHHDRMFQRRRDDLENREAATLIRSRSHERLGLRPYDSDGDDYYDARAPYAGRSGRRSVRESVQYDYGTGYVNSPPERQLPAKYYGSGGIGGPGGMQPVSRPRRYSLSPDRQSVASSKAEGSIRRAASTAVKSRHARNYEEGSVAGSDVQNNRYAESAAGDDSRRFRRREREAIEREERANQREAAILRREKELAGAGGVGGTGEQRNLPIRAIEDNPHRNGTGIDFLQDGTKYYKKSPAMAGIARRL